jgi:hypothetical protein
VARHANKKNAIALGFLLIILIPVWVFNAIMIIIAVIRNIIFYWKKQAIPNKTPQQ